MNIKADNVISHFVVFLRSSSNSSSSSSSSSSSFPSSPFPSLLLLLLLLLPVPPMWLLFLLLRHRVSSPLAFHVRFSSYRIPSASLREKNQNCPKLPQDMYVKRHSHWVRTFKARVHWAELSPVCLFCRVLSATDNRQSDGRELTVSAGRLRKSSCPLSQLLLRTAVSCVTYVKKTA